MTDEAETFWVTCGVVAFVVCAIAVLAVFASRSPDKDSYRIYHMRYGTAYCGRAVVYNCGVSLSSCTDDKTYVCLQDVMYEAPQ